ncbi:hypothetical protein [Streptomyces sp. SBT349]|uniref:hypothetical protein n=1 Tax=Streptomyces sp. SBT349 TaxID=1580539 RepID=UPI00066D44BE|nr:hypothetical protein [Streptomyces sp. SBT349]
MNPKLKQARGLAGGQKCRPLAVVGVQPMVAVGVDQAWDDGFVRHAVARVGGDRVFADRDAGDLEPLLPLVGSLRLVIGVQQQPPAERTSAAMFPQKMQGGLAHPGPAEPQT